MSGRGHPPAKGGSLPYDPDWMSKLPPVADPGEKDTAPAQQMQVAGGDNVSPHQDDQSPGSSTQPDWPRFGNK